MLMLLALRAAFAAAPAPPPLPVEHDPPAVAAAVRAVDRRLPVDSTLALAKVRASGRFPDREDKLTYWLARALIDHKMPASAEIELVRLAARGPDNPYFPYAFAKLSSLAHETGDYSALTTVVTGIPAEKIPESSRNIGYYLLGLHLYEQGRTADARGYFAQVSEKADVYWQSRYLEGVIFTHQGKLKSAVHAFTEIAKAERRLRTPQELQEADELRDLSLLNIGRIYFSLGRYADAQTYYGYVPAKSAYAGRAAVEGATAAASAGDLAAMEGKLPTAESAGAYLPDAALLRAIADLQAGRLAAVTARLEVFKATWTPALAEMTRLQAFGNDDAAAIEVYRRILLTAPPVLPPILVDHFRRDHELRGALAHLVQLDAEEHRIGEQPKAWQDVLAEPLRAAIAADRARLQAHAGRVLLRRMRDTTVLLTDQLAQAEEIRLAAAR